MATGWQSSQNGNEEILSNWLQLQNNYQHNLMKDESTASSVDLNNDDDDIDDNDDNRDTEASSVLGDEDDMTSQDVPTETAKKKRRQLKKYINIKKADVVKFISETNKYSQELGEKLKSVCAEVELVPDKSLIIVTKKLRSRRINDWNKRCCSMVTKFCSRFKKTCFELNKSNSVKNGLPKLGRMLKWSNAAYWMESNNKRLAVMTEQSEYEQVLENVREFLGNYGMRNTEVTEEHRSDKGKLGIKKLPEYGATKDIVASNPFNMKDADVAKVLGQANSLKQLQISVNIDNDIVSFLLKRKKYSEELKSQLFHCGAELEMFKSGLIKMKKVDGITISNWEERCEETVHVFCSCFRKKYFPLDDEIRDSIPEALSTLQKDVSSTGGACWLDTQKQNLVLVCPSVVAFGEGEKEVNQFFEKVRRFSRKSFQIEEPILELVRKDLPKLKEALKSCNITLKKKTLVVVCLRNEVDNVAEKVENFLKNETIRNLNAVFSTSLVGGSVTTSPTQNRTEFKPSLYQETLMSAQVKPMKLKPVTVRVNHDVAKLVMNDTRLNQELAEQLARLNAKIEWISGKSVIVKVIQKSEDVPVPKWSENCQNVVKTFFQKFSKKHFPIQTDMQDAACNTLNVFRESISCFRADCWLTSNNRELVLVVFKDNFQSVVKLVEGFLQNLGNGDEKPKKVTKFVEISSDHVDYIERTQFLNTLKKCHPEMAEASITQAKNEICFMGSDEAISIAKQQYEDLVKELNVMILELPSEVMQLVSKKEGLEFIDSRLSNRQLVYVIVVGDQSVKVVARSSQVCDEVKDCLCRNVSEATILLPPQSEHIFASKKWYEISKAIEEESLVNYQINFEQETRHDIKLHGTTHRVEYYKKMVTDFINAQEVECHGMRLPTGIARFMKEKLSDEIAKIEADFKEEQVKIHFLPERNTCECKGTKKGIHESERRVQALGDQIISESKDYSRIGICTLFFSENGQRNIKGIEAGSNVIMKVDKELDIVEKESTQAEVEAIRAERAQGKSKTSQVPSTNPFDQCNFTTNEGLKVSWKYGNIEQERADILVSSALSDLRNPTMVGRVMNSVGGSSFVAACSQHTNIGTGDIATTIGGNLLCKHVIHAVCCSWSSKGVAEQILRRLLQKILLECTQLLARSVAMPLIGTGKHRFPEDLVLRVMREEFEKFSSIYSSGTLREIKLIRYDPGGRKTPVQAPSVSSSTHQLASSSNQPASNTFVPLVAGSSAEKVKLQVFARSSQDLSAAFGEIEKFIQSHLTSRTINHEKLYDVVLKHWDELKPLTKDNDLKITCVHPTTVLIIGISRKVDKAKDKLTKLLSRYTNEEQKWNQLSYISQNVQWYYFDLSNKEVPYSAQLNGAIELARMNGEATVEIKEPDGQKYIVSLSQMVATNTSSRSYRNPDFALFHLPGTRSIQTKKVTRKWIGSAASPGSELPLPTNWTSQPENQLVQLVTIPSSSQEFQEVQNHFVARGGNASQLYKVERIQNPQLYFRYLAFKKSMRGQVNEMRLFHGTDAANVESINAHNFSRSFAGVNGVAYGHGVYFARDASYSMRYANRQLSRFSQSKMYMAKVLVGDYTKGAQGMKAPPLKNDPNNPGLRYDSVVDHLNNPSMYVIFQDNQYYPEYLLTMR